MAVTKKGLKRIKKSEKSQGVLKYEIIDNTVPEQKQELKEQKFKEQGAGKKVEEETKKTPKEKQEPVFASSEKPKKESYVKTLVFLIILILVIDSLALYFYYKPDLSRWFKPKVIESGNNLKCDDGTLYDSCSKDKPLFCYNGELVKKAYTCGCPSGYKVAFQDCKKI